MNPWPLIGNLLGWGLLILIVAAIVMFIILMIIGIRGMIRGARKSTDAPSSTPIISKESR